MTLFKGRISPSILEYKHFEGRLVKKGKTIPWTNHRSYNQRSLSPDEEAYLSNFDTRAFLVINDDQVLFEKYWDGFSDTTWSNSFSMAKSFVSLALGVALKKGQIKSLDEPIDKYLPLYNAPEKNGIPIKHFLTMSSGMNYSESYLNPFGYAAKANYGNDLKSLLEAYHQTEESGKRFKYQSGDSQSLSFLISEISGQSLSDYFSENVWSKLGPKRDALWSLDDKNGHEKAFCCFNSNAKDFAKIGKLMLNYGNWAGEHIVDSSYVQEATKAANLLEKDGAKNRRYGYQWWLGSFHGQNVFYARGINGQYIFCIPEKNMIVVRLGFKRSTERIEGHPSDVFEYLKIALAIGEQSS